MRRGALEYCVLALVNHEERYGAEIAEILYGAGTLFESPGTLYPLLARLRQDGLVTTKLQPSERGAARRYYRITPKGRSALAAFTARWELFRDSVDEVLKGGL
jgi:PadR family transcriptional regulator PadR